MEEEAKAVQESAKAVQEVAKATGKGIDVSRELGGFVSRFIAGSLEQGMGIVEDKLKYMRCERAMRMMHQVENVMNELGMKGPTRAIPMKVAIPILQAASLEEDDDLQDLWVKLLVNAADADREVEVRRAFVSILQDFGSLEAQIMQMIYTRVDVETMGAIWTKYLPGKVEIEQPKEDENAAPSADVQMALSNLVRLGCLTSAMMWGGGSSLNYVYPTVLGLKLVDACRLRNELKLR